MEHHLQHHHLYHHHIMENWPLEQLVQQVHWDLTVIHHVAQFISMVWLQAFLLWVEAYHQIYGSFQLPHKNSYHMWTTCRLWCMEIFVFCWYLERFSWNYFVSCDTWCCVLRPLSEFFKSSKGRMWFIGRISLSSWIGYVKNVSGPGSVTAGKKKFLNTKNLTTKLHLAIWFINGMYFCMTCRNGTWNPTRNW
jgi:hypothetical protein